jgi:rubrerythrin
MSFADRMEKLLDHWLDHNADHAATYRQWAEKAREHGMEAVADRLEEAARMTLEINETFSAAARSLK